VKMHDAFPGNYLKADQIQKPTEVIIDRVEMADFDDGSKPVVYFRGKQLGAVLNKTRWAAIESILMAQDTDDWVGRRIIIKRGQTMFQGKSVGTIAFEAVPGASEEMAPDDIPF
jgi:hypothetical protein